MPAWMTEHTITWDEVLFGVTLFVITFVASLAFTAWLLIRLPETYFSAQHPPAFLWERHHPALRIAALVGKNLAGVILVIVGIILSLPGVPGQGLLTILLGVMLLNFPGKRRLEIWLVSLPRVYNAISKLRARFGKPPLVLDERPSS